MVRLWRFSRRLSAVSPIWVAGPISALQEQSITEDIKQLAWPQVGELGVSVQDAFAKEAALL